MTIDDAAGKFLKEISIVQSILLKPSSTLGRKMRLGAMEVSATITIRFIQGISDIETYRCG
jgi:hypothetical protein